MNDHAATIDDSAIFPSANGSPCPRLLIVEDDADMRELHARVLNLEGYQVETACDGAAGLERLAVEEFDLVVTDRAMPNLDGVSMVLALRSAGSQVPIVMVSGSLALAPLPPQVACEFSAMLPKPARTAEILSAITHALRRIPRPECRQARSTRPLPPIVRIVLMQAARHRMRGQIPPVKFKAQVDRLAREELEPRGLSVLVRELRCGSTRFIIKTTATGQVRDMIEIGPDGGPSEEIGAEG
ncbi:MAG: response regulator transcription factor [Verrucomicrobia bacterium]|nr:response regulator transcription factor [Verrucomicrobiota bacterium]